MAANRHGFRRFMAVLLSFALFAGNLSFPVIAESDPSAFIETAGNPATGTDLPDSDPAKSA